MARPSLIDTFMDMARLMAERSTCGSKHKVGAILINGDHRILATGYNGAPRGFYHCDEPEPGANCELGLDGRCIRALHAEVNVLLQCAQYGIPCNGTTMCITHAPCERCARMLIQAGIYEIWYDTVTSSNGLHILQGRVYCNQYKRE